jgi:undecaprenyl-diphosphatase
MHAILLGIIEGLTEFLPISSTGHLIVAEELTGFRDIAKLFTVVIQLGAIAAVLWFYRSDIFSRFKSLMSGDKKSYRFWLNLVIATIPAGLMGLLLDDLVKNISKPFTVALMLVLGGFALLWVENNHTRRNERRRPHTHSEAQLDDITSRQALGIGLAQTVSLIPGVSRSGASIVGGLLAGLDRVTATAFSFYLSIPVMILAAAYKLIKERSEIPNITGGPVALVFGTLAAFITALMAINWLLRYISHHDFKGFAYYRILFGSFLMILIALRFVR